MITIAERRDFYNTSHFSWHEPTVRDKKNEFGIDYYTHLMKNVLSTDKVAVATLAIRGKDGVRPDLGIINRGDAKKWCFTKVYSEKELKDNPSIGTSQAAVAIGSIAFYIRQLEGVSATDTMDIMRSCAIDLGEVGVDREYGWGEPSVQCAKVKDKEVQTLVSSAKVAHQSTGSILAKGTSPESDDISSSPISSVFSPDEGVGNQRQMEGFTLSLNDLLPAKGFSVAYLQKENFTGGRTFVGRYHHQTGRFSFNLLGGEGENPLGVSSLYKDKKNNAFLQGVAGFDLLESRDTNVSVSASFGEEYGAFEVKRVDLGLSATHNLTKKSSFSLSANHAVADMKAGLHGYEMAGASKVSATKNEDFIALKYSRKF